MKKAWKFILIRERVAFFLVIFVIMCFAFWKEAGFYYNKYQVLHAPPDQIRRLGRHSIVGYEDYRVIKQLVRQGAVGGVYITQRNVRGKSVGQIQKEICELQRIQKTLGLSPLFVVADQEGGIVSRMTPPLTKQPPLSELLANCSSHEALDKKIIQYATVQAEGLSELGVNVNLSPVVDLRIEHTTIFKDVRTLIHKRAISKDKSMVAKVALTYCRVFKKSGIFPTLKHFPGLGNVKEDTHYFTGELDIEPEHLNENDWYPFKKIIQETNAFIMLGHVKVNQIDPQDAVSFSKKVIQGVIRQDWKHDGILITDDLNMGPVCSSKLGIGGTSVKALNAGVDFAFL